MFGFKKNEKPTLIIEAKDLMEIIKSDYDNDMAFTLIEFSYNEKKYVMGSCVLRHHNHVLAMGNPTVRFRNSGQSQNKKCTLRHWHEKPW